MEREGIPALKFVCAAAGSWYARAGHTGPNTTVFGSDQPASGDRPTRWKHSPCLWLYEPRNDSSFGRERRYGEAEVDRGRGRRTKERESKNGVRGFFCFPPLSEALCDPPPTTSLQATCLTRETAYRGQWHFLFHKPRLHHGRKRRRIARTGLPTGRSPLPRHSKWNPRPG